MAAANAGGPGDGQTRRRRAGLAALAVVLVAGLVAIIVVFAGNKVRTQREQFGCRPSCWWWPHSHPPLGSSSSHAHPTLVYNVQDQNKSVEKSGTATTPMVVMGDTTVPFSHLIDTATTTKEAPVNLKDGKQQSKIESGHT